MLHPPVQAAPEPPLEAAAGERIHLAEELHPDDRASLRRHFLGNLRINRPPWISLALLTGVMVVTQLSPALERLLGYAMLVMWAVVGLFVACSVVWMLYLDVFADEGKSKNTRDGSPRRPDPAYRMDGLPEHSDPAYRVRLTGFDPADEEIAASLAAAAEGRSTDFSDPEVFSAFVISAPHKGLALRCFVSVSLALAVLAVVWIAFQLRWTSVLWIGALFFGMLIPLTWTSVWPSQARVLPGRLDLLRYGFLGSGQPTVESFDLRTMRLLIGEDDLVNLARDSDDEGVWISGAEGLGPAVLAAAFSKFEAQPAEEPAAPPSARAPRLLNTLTTPRNRLRGATAEHGDSGPEPVHIAGAISHDDRRSLWRSMVRLFNIDLLPEWLAATAAAALAALIFARVDPRLEADLVIVAIVLAVCTLVVRWFLRSRHNTYVVDRPRVTDPNRRLRITGWAPQLRSAAALVSRVQGGEVLAQPRCYRVTHASGHPLLLAFRVASCAAAFFFAVWAARMWCWPHYGARATMAEVLLSLALARAAWPLLFPIRVRISPGRLEIRRWPLLRLGRPALEVFDLRTARLLVDLRSGRLNLRRADTPEDDPGVWLSGVLIDPVGSGREMGLAALAAALTPDAEADAAGATPAAE